MTRSIRFVPVVGAALALGLGGSSAIAHDSRQHTSAWDKQWLQTSIEGDIFEITGGKLAEQKGASAGVRAYGARLVSDHTKSLREATALAHRLGIQVPKAPSPSMQWELATVAKFSGAQFDANYADLEAKDHQQDISEAQDEVKDGTNRSVRGEAAKEIPTLREHLRIAEQLGGHLGVDPLG